MGRKLVFLGLGTYFGFVLSRVGASDYDLIYAMFTLEDLKLARILFTAIITAGIIMKLLKSFGNTGYKGQEINIILKPLSPLNVVGGIVFGMGWAISGACPGTVLAQVGEGKALGLFTFGGLILGTYLYALLVEKNPKFSH